MHWPRSPEQSGQPSLPRGIWPCKPGEPGIPPEPYAPRTTGHSASPPMPVGGIEN